MNDSQTKQSIAANYSCKYCGKTFILQHHFINHYCRQMQISDDMDTVVGKAAHMYYCDWLQFKGRLVVRNPQTFMASKQFRAFISFAEWARKVKLLNPQEFIRMMVNKDILPAYWVRDEVYVLYLEHLDSLPPLSQVETSLKTLADLADSNNIEISKVIELMSGMDIIHLLRSRRLSPWLCLMSKKFRVAFVKCSTEHQIIIESIIHPERWAENLSKFPEEVTKIKQIVTSFGL